MKKIERKIKNKNLYKYKKAVSENNYFSFGNCRHAEIKFAFKVETANSNT
jgi:hypothetical protein